MKSIANTAIEFGLINLPVAICKATGEHDDVKFNLGDAQGRKLTQQYVDPEGNKVEKKDQTKTIDGIIVDAESLEAIAERTKLPTLRIEKMEDRERFTAEQYRTTGYYYLQSPKKGGNVNTFKLLADAMEAEGKVAVTKFTFRSRQQQIVIWPKDGILHASSMAFNTDVREADEEVRAHLAGSYSDAEFAMARQLIAAMGNDTVDPLSSDTDEAIILRHDLVERVKGGEKIEKPAEASQPEKNAALADALAASLAALKPVAA